MACWHRDLSLPQIYIAACKDRTQVLGRGSIHVECYKGSRKWFWINEDRLGTNADAEQPPA